MLCYVKCWTFDQKSKSFDILKIIVDSDKTLNFVEDKNILKSNSIQVYFDIGKTLVRFAESKNTFFKEKTECRFLMFFHCAKNILE